MKKTFSRMAPMYQAAKEELRTEFPCLFRGDRHPWKIGTYEDIIAVRPDFKTRWHSRYLRDFCLGEKYLRATIAGKKRIGYDGTFYERPTDEQIAYAEAQLKKKGKV